MKKHVLRPIWVALGLVALVLLVRHFVVPDDFGVHGRNFTYGFHRLSNIEEWKAFPVKYRGEESCAECHEEKAASKMTSKHRKIQCENCHGPILNHPEDPEKLNIDRRRQLCLRCHTLLVYPTSGRANIKGIDPEAHNPGTACSECHDPHKPDMEG